MTIIETKPIWNSCYQITTHYACFAIWADAEGYVIKAAPIARWTEGRRLEYVLNYYRGKGAKIDNLSEGAGHE